MDLLSMEDNLPSPTSGAAFVSGSGGGGGVGLSADASRAIPALLRAAALTRGAKSVIARTDILTISVTADYRAHQGRLAVFFDNTSNFDIMNLKVVVEPVKGATGCLNVKQQDPSVRVSPGEEGRMQLAVECVKPFSDAYPLEMDIRFTVSGNPYAYRVPLPVTVGSFFDALPTDKATYMARWKALEGADNEAQLVFSSARPVDPALLHHIRSAIAPAMRLGLAEGLDNEKTVTGCCSFLTGTIGADGKALAVGVLMRLEGDPAQGKFRITARAKGGTVAHAVKNFFVAQLSA
jgi:hypothetical protein